MRFAIRAELKFGPVHEAFQACIDSHSAPTHSTAGHARAWRCERRFAVKIVNKASVQKPRAYAKLKSEIAIHRTLQHERVVKMHTYFEDTENVYILLELCPSQTLNDLLRRRKRFTEPEAIYYMSSAHALFGVSLHNGTGSRLQLQRWKINFSSWEIYFSYLKIDFS